MTGMTRDTDEGRSRRKRRGFVKHLLRLSRARRRWEVVKNRHHALMDAQERQADTAAVTVHVDTA